MKDIIIDQLEKHIKVVKDTKELANIIAKIIGDIIDCYNQGGKVILFGNGGSAADAQHIAAEFVGILRRSSMRPALNAIALTTNTSIITAVSNDFGSAHIFERQIEAIVEASDVVIGLSTSGSSENVMLALIKAKELGAKTIGLLGGNGGSILDIADISLVIPTKDTPNIQEVHITVGHIICDLVEQELKGEDI